MNGFQIFEQTAGSKIAHRAVRLAVSPKVEGGKCPAAAGAPLFQGDALFAVAIAAETMNENDGAGAPGIVITQIAAQNLAGR